eukprot:4768728-Amphidinium_carterae.1
MEVTLWKEACIRHDGKTKSRPCTAIPFVQRAVVDDSVTKMTQEERVGGGSSCSNGQSIAVRVRNPKTHIISIPS